ncbi:BON domain-containing protein [Azospirillum sp. sgz302134]
MANNDRWWRDDRSRADWNSSGWRQGGERDVRGLGQHRDYGRDMLNDMRRYAGRDDWGRDDRHRNDWGQSDWSRDAGRSDYGRMGYRDAGYGRSGYDYGRGGHYGGGTRDERGFFERAGDEMASWFGDDDAERRRRMDAWRGDEGAQHHRGRGPRGYSRSDERIREDVSDRLTDDPYVDASDIELTVSGGEVTLSGTVDDRRVKRRAEDIAESVAGVRHVQNNLRVGRGMGSSTTSAGAASLAGTGSSSSYDTRTTGTVGGMNTPATRETADTDSTTRR